MSRSERVSTVRETNLSCERDKVCVRRVSRVVRRLLWQLTEGTSSVSCCCWSCHKGSSGNDDVLMY
jgi:hypothetical protein